MHDPRVTILLPVYNESKFIDACLESLAAQDYQGEIEIIVADGGSSDDTLDRVEQWTDDLPGLSSIDNPRRVQSHALNLAAQAASGEILIRADAHSTYAPDYVSRSVSTLAATSATVVGGVQTASAQPGFGAAVAKAMDLPLATGPGLARHATERLEADTVYLGAFRKSDWERLGGWRTLPSKVAEDADLNFRWRRQGARIVVEPSIESTYHPRDTVRGLWRQYYRYGLGKADMLYVNGRWPSWRPAAPLALVVGLAASAVAGLLVGSWLPLITLVAVWLGALAISSSGRPIVILASSVMHLSYGLGLLRGLLRWPPSVRANIT